MTSPAVGGLEPADLSVTSLARQGTRVAVLGSLLREARPKQWLKNVLVFAAAGAGGVLLRPDVAGRTALAFVGFSLAASSTYFLNDLADVESDRRHPHKRGRPVASGAVPITTARGVAVILCVAALAVGSWLGWRFDAVLIAYLLTAVAYTFWLKHQAVLDIASVASGFVLRAIAGGVAAGVPLSNWFLIVATFSSLFMVAGKRAGELHELGGGAAEVRSSLAAYTPEFLRYVWMMSSGVAITAYCVWAFDQAAHHAGAPLYQLSIVPFGLAILRYALLIEQGQGGAPEDVVTGDTTLLILGMLWLAVFGVAVLLGR